MEDINDLKITKHVKTEAEDISNKLNLQKIFGATENKNVSKNQQIVENEEDEENKSKTNKFVDIILRHSKELNLNAVAEQIKELQKEQEKKEKKKEEKKKSILKLQDQTSKAAYYAHDQSTKKANGKTHLKQYQTSSAFKETFSLLISIPARVTRIRKI